MLLMRTDLIIMMRRCKSGLQVNCIFGGVGMSDGGDGNHEGPTGVGGVRNPKVSDGWSWGSGGTGEGGG